MGYGWLEEAAVLGVGGAVGGKDLAVVEEGCEESAGTLSGYEWERKSCRILVLKTDIVTTQTPSVIRGVERIAEW